MRQEWSGYEVLQILPEGIWGSILFSIATDLQTLGWNDEIIQFEFALLIASACGALISRFRQGMVEGGWAVLYLASTAGMMAQANNSWTRLLLIIVTMVYIQFWKNMKDKRQAT